MASRRRTIFSFPQSVAEQILMDVPLSELFDISLLSKRAFALIKNIPMTECDFDVVLSASPSVHAFYGNDMAKWHFYDKRDSERLKLEDLETRTVSVSDGESGTLSFARTSDIRYGCRYDSIQDVLQFIQWICSLFNYNIDRLIVESAQFQNLKAVQSVEALKKSKQVHIMYGTVSHEEMVHVIGGFESVLLEIYCDPGPNFNYDRPICFRNLYVYSGSWAKGPMLLNFHSAYVSVMNVDVTEEDAIAFLIRILENQDGCGNVCAATFYRVANDSEFVYDNRHGKTWDLDKITNAEISFEQEIPPTNPENLRRFWRENRTNFIDVKTYPENPETLGLLKDGRDL